MNLEYMEPMRNVTHITSVRFELQEILGQGSSAVVYKALRTDTELGLQQTVALKILKSQNLVEAWKREFRSLSQVRSKYCVQVFGFECWNQRPALVLEFVDGLPLEEIPDLTSEQVREVLAQIQNGLRDLHDQGLFHGDLSLHNVLLDRTGQVHLLDFGLGNTSESANFATLQFAAPEIVEGQTPDYKSDLYSLARIEQVLLQAISNFERLTMHQNLAGDRASRDWLDLAEDPRVRQALAERVDQLKKKRLPTPTTLTHRVAIHRWSRSLRTFALGSVIFFLLALTPHVQSHSWRESDEPPGRSTVAIVTKHWYRVSVNGKDRGFTPMAAEQCAAGPIVIQWKGAKSSGQRTLTLLPGQNTVLQDSFFEQ
jgi:serine/threonine protein kinase